jgi:hypothetical protein
VRPEQFPYARFFVRERYLVLPAFKNHIEPYTHINDRFLYIERRYNRSDITMFNKKRSHIGVVQGRCNPNQGRSTFEPTFKVLIAYFNGNNNSFQNDENKSPQTKIRCGILQIKSKKGRSQPKVLETYPGTRSPRRHISISMTAHTIKIQIRRYHNQPFYNL